jgi:hypothetical protein
MKPVFASLALAGWGLLVGCQRDEAAAVPEPDVLLRSHFVGLARMVNDPKAAKLKEISGLPQSAALREQTLRKLARSPQILFKGRVTPEQAEQGATFLRPLLNDLVDEETLLEVHGREAPNAEWTLAVALKPVRKALWQTNLAALAQTWGWGSVSRTTVEGFAASEVKRAQAPTAVRWVDAGAWLVLGIGSAPLSATDRLVKTLKTTGRPTASLTESWLESEAALGKLAGPLGLSPKLPWPQASVSVGSREEYLRTTMRLNFAEPVTGSIAPWHVPTNLVREPLISFTAARGVAPLLERSETLRRLELGSTPNEVFFWAQQPVAFQSLLAFPCPGATNVAQGLATRVPTLLGTNLQKRGLTQIEWQSTNQQALWKSLPFITPFARPARAGNLDFLVAGLFPPVFTTNALPADLLAQFVNRTNTLYYDWEITQARLEQWRMMVQLFAMIGEQPQFTTNTAALPWLMSVEKHLGNSVTEVVADSPRTWTLTRKSHLGMTAVELVAFARWLESVNFPRLGFELPSLPRAQGRKPPAQP